MRLSRQYQACLLLFFFYEKILRAQSHSQWNINQQSKIKQTLNNKGTNFSRAQTCKRVKVACLAFLCFLCAQNLFVKKKKKQAWNYLDNLILLYYWVKNLLVIFGGFEQIKTPFGETPWLTGRHATSLVTLFFGTTSFKDLRERFLLLAFIYLTLLPTGFKAFLGPAVQPQS